MLGSDGPPETADRDRNSGGEKEGAEMDFSTVELSGEDQQFFDRARKFLADNVTDDVLRRAQQSGDGFVAELHRAMGEQGWLEREANTAGGRFHDGPASHLGSGAATCAGSDGDVGCDPDDSAGGAPVRYARAAG